MYGASLNPESSKRPTSSIPSASRGGGASAAGAASWDGWRPVSGVISAGACSAVGGSPAGVWSGATPGGAPARAGADSITVVGASSGAEGVPLRSASLELEDMSRGCAQSEGRPDGRPSDSAFRGRASCPV